MCIVTGKSRLVLTMGDNFMNSAHLHLILVHIPIVLLPTGLVLFLIGNKWGGRPIISVALNLFVVASIFAIAAYLLGEEAEEIVENIKEISQSALESHEDSASLALWMTVGLGVISLIDLVAYSFYAKRSRLLSILIFVIAVASSGAIAFTAQEGGKIRHPEAFPEANGVSH